jgi:hypothetical protein
VGIRGMSDLLATQDNPLKTTGQTLWIETDAIVVKYGVLYYGFLGTKRIPVKNIKTISWRDLGSVIGGFLEFTVLGESAPSPFASPNVQHQNRFIYNATDIDRWFALKEWIEINMELETSGKSESAADEIRKLADLLKDGLISPDEFEVQKSKVFKRI